MQIIAAFRSAIKNSSFWINLIFSILTFILIFFVINPRLFYLQYQPFFAFDGAYNDYMFQFHSGYLSILSQFILQFMYYPLIGSLLLTCLFLIQVLCLQKAFHTFKSTWINGFEWIFPLFFLFLMKSCSTGIEVFISLLIANFFYLSSEYLRRNFIAHLLFNLLSIGLLFSIFHLPVVLLFIIFLFPDRRTNLKSFFTWTSFLSGLILLGILIFVSHNMRWLLAEFSQFSFFDLNTGFPGTWFLLSAIFFLRLIGWFKSLMQNVPSINKRPLESWYFALLLLLIILLAFKPLFVFKGKYALQIDYSASLSDWKKVLSLKDKINQQDRIPRVQLNRALANSGKLADDLFSVSQDWGEYGLFLTKEFDAQCLTYSSDQFLDLGFAKGSQYWMIETETKNPYNPKVLQRLATTSLMLGEYSTARKYFTILKKSLIYKKTAEKSLTKIHDDPGNFAKQLAPKNITLIDNFSVLNLKQPDLDLISILKSNRKNKIAFEYLMAYYILRTDLDNFMRYMPLVMNSGYYKSIPISYEEALLVYYSKNKIPKNNWPYPVSDSTNRRFAQFIQMLGKVNQGPSYALNLKTSFKNSYWYYLNFENPTLKGHQLIFNPL